MTETLDSNFENLFAPKTIATTRPTHRSTGSAMVLGAILLLVSLAVLPYATATITAISAFLPMYATAVIAADLTTSYLLCSQAKLFDRPSLFVLSAGYLFTGLTAAIQIMMFPGVFSAGGLLGAGPQSAVWLWMLWHGGFPVFVASYAFAASREAPGPAMRAAGRSWLALPGVAILVAGFAFLVTRGHQWLPPLVVDGSYVGAFRLGVAQTVIASNVLGLAVLAVVGRGRTTVQVWLLVAALASLLDSIVTLAGGARFSLGWYVARLDSVAASVVILGTFLGEMSRLYGHVLALNRRLAEMAMVDGLTGIANRRRFDDMLEQEWKRASRSRSEVSLLILDVDHFKKFNDAMGHPAGDRCLRAVAQAAASCSLRETDLAARYGGEEFVLLLPGTDAEGALTVAERCREAVHRLAIRHPQNVRDIVTVSIGVATVVPRGPGNPDSLIRAADAALYRAKHDGRDRCRAAEPGMEPSGRA